MKIRILLACYVMLTAFPVMSEQTNIGSAGDIHFSITINQGACELEKENIDVDMGSVTLQKPARVGRELNQKKFSIGLVNCENVARAYVTMDGIADSTNPNLFALDSGGATGIAIKIVKDGDGQVYPASTDPTPIEYIIMTNGSHKLNYVASYVPVKRDATAGAANATVNFSIVYE